jgi:hypothetical protein
MKLRLDKDRLNLYYYIVLISRRNSAITMLPAGRVSRLNRFEYPEEVVLR